MKALFKPTVQLIFFLLTFSLSIKDSKAQTTLEHQAPTLQVGLDGFSFGRGTLDYQLIMEIVAEKQQELKIKAIQNVFLSKVSGAGGTIYSFTNNVVRELVLEKDPEIRTRKILENTVNLVFVVSYLEYYLHSLKNNLTAQSEFVKLAKVYGYTDQQAKVIFSVRNLVTKKRDKSQVVFEDKAGVELLSLLLDMTSEVVRHDEKLKQLGLMQISYSATYDYMNRFNRLDIDSCKTIVSNSPGLLKRTLLSKDEIAILEKANSTEECGITVQYAKAVYQTMSAKLKQVTDYIGLANYVVDHFSFRNDKLASFSDAALRSKAALGGGSFRDQLIAIDKGIDSLISRLVREHANDTVAQRHINKLAIIQFYIKKAITQISSGDEKTSIGSDILYTLYSQFIPELIQQSYRDYEYIPLISKISSASATLAESLLAGNKAFEIRNGKVDNFLLIAAKLYQFDRASTISEYVKLIEDIGYIFPDDRIKNALSTIVTFIKDYTVTDTDAKGKEVLNFDVESFLVKLSAIRPYRFTPWQFHFTVGVNTGYFYDGLTMEDGSTATNLSFVSEKIGVKYKIRDRGFWWPRNPGETYVIRGKNYIKTGPPIEPLISNVHIVLYGSGLLYNVVNTKTNKEFNSPMIGIGPGITFSNALDFNVSYAVPLFSSKNLETSLDHPFINIGFDIQFVEYYNRLREKQKANKTQKRLAEAAD